MAVKKSRKRTAGGRKAKAAVARGTGGVRKAVRKAGKRVAKASKKTRKAASKAVTGVTRRVKAAASNPRRSISRAASNVHETASRASDIGDSVVTAGHLIKETAEFVDSLAGRAKSRAEAGRVKKKKQ